MKIPSVNVLELFFDSTDSDLVLRTAASGRSNKMTVNVGQANTFKCFSIRWRQRHVNRTVKFSQFPAQYINEPLFVNNRKHGIR